MKRLLFSVSLEDKTFKFDSNGCQTLSGDEMISLASALTQVSASLLSTALQTEHYGKFDIGLFSQRKPS